jgi:hypothetical protein
MATIINTPTDRRDTADSSLGLILGVIIAIALVVLFFVYGLPALRQGAGDQQGGTNINVSLPGGSQGGGAGSGSTNGGGSGGGGSTGY